MPSSPDCDVTGLGPIVLVGMMATGKTTVARRLGRRFDRRVYDSDAMIVARTGSTVAELWEAGGEAAFRDLETAVLDEALQASPPGVVAAAGGIVISATNRAHLRQASAEGAVVVWLRADPAVLAARVRPGDHRPLLADDPVGTLARLSAERRDLYAEVAEIAVDTGTAPFSRVVEDVVAELCAVVAGRRSRGASR